MDSITSAVEATHGQQFGRAAVSMSDPSDRDLACARFDMVKGNSAKLCYSDSVDLLGVRGL